MDDQNESDHLDEIVNNSTHLLGNSSSPSVAVNITKSSPNSDVRHKNNVYPVNISWHGLSYVVRRRISKEYVIILKNVTGEAKAGELIAILGPSGAGKTTLLNILVGLIQKQVNGKIIVNGKERKLDSFRKLMCFIQQQNEVLPDLSLKETLTVAANLKLDKNIPREEKCKIVRETLEFWKLYDCKDTMVQKLSGGQRKRLSIAQEVINKPPLIFLDEPTSGLDSLSCVRCISILKNLAQQGHNVICSIHQPTALHFEQFNRVCFLNNGECLYNGPRNSLLPFLSECDLECPVHHNPADFVIEAALGEYGEDKAEKLILANIQRYQSDITSHSINCDSKLESSSKKKLAHNENGDADSSYMANLLPYDQDEISQTPTRDYPTSFCNQFMVLFGRATLGVCRSWMVSHIFLLSHIVVALALGALYFGIGNDAGKLSENVACLFFTVIFIGFASTMGTVLTFPVEMPVIKREIFNRWYAVRAYYLSRTLADIPLQIILPIIFGSIVYWMTAQPNDVARFVLFLCLLIIIALICQTMGLCVGAILKIQIAVFIGPIVFLLPPMLFCGFFIRLNVIPSYLRWISYISFFRYGFEGVLLANYGFNRTSLECHQQRCEYENPEDFLEHLGIKDSLLYVNFIALAAILVISRIFAFVLLKWKTTRAN